MTVRLHQGVATSESASSFHWPAASRSFLARYLSLLPAVACLEALRVFHLAPPSFELVFETPLPADRPDGAATCAADNNPAAAGVRLVTSHPVCALIAVASGSSVLVLRPLTPRPGAYNWVELRRISLSGAATAMRWIRNSLLIATTSATLVLYDLSDDVSASASSSRPATPISVSHRPLWSAVLARPATRLVRADCMSQHPAFASYADHDCIPRIWMPCSASSFSAASPLPFGKPGALSRMQAHARVVSLPSPFPMCAAEIDIVAPAFTFFYLRHPRAIFALTWRVVSAHDYSKLTILTSCVDGLGRIWRWCSVACCFQLILSIDAYALSNDFYFSSDSATFPSLPSTPSSKDSSPTKSVSEKNTKISALSQNTSPSDSSDHSSSTNNLEKANSSSNAKADNGAHDVNTVEKPFGSTLYSEIEASLPLTGSRSSYTGLASVVEDAPITATCASFSNSNQSITKQGHTAPASTSGDILFNQDNMSQASSFSNLSRVKQNQSFYTPSEFDDVSVKNTKRRHPLTYHFLNNSIICPSRDLLELVFQKLQPNYVTPGTLSSQKSHFPTSVAQFYEMHSSELEKSSFRRVAENFDEILLVVMSDGGALIWGISNLNNTFHKPTATLIKNISHCVDESQAKFFDAIKIIHQTHIVDPEHIFIIGGSLEGSVACFSLDLRAVFDPHRPTRLKKLHEWCGHDNLRSSMRIFAFDHGDVISRNGPECLRWSIHRVKSHCLLLGPGFSFRQRRSLDASSDIEYPLGSNVVVSVSPPKRRATCLDFEFQLPEGWAHARVTRRSPTAFYEFYFQSADSTRLHVYKLPEFSQLLLVDFQSAVIVAPASASAPFDFVVFVVASRSLQLLSTSGRALCIRDLHEIPESENVTHISAAGAFVVCLTSNFAYVYGVGLVHNFLEHNCTIPVEGATNACLYSLDCVGIALLAVIKDSLLTVYSSSTHESDPVCKPDWPIIYTHNFNRKIEDITWFPNAELGLILSDSSLAHVTPFVSLLLRAFSARSAGPLHPLVLQELLSWNARKGVELLLCSTLCLLENGYDPFNVGTECLVPVYQDFTKNTDFNFSFDTSKAESLCALLSKHPQSVQNTLYMALANAIAQPAPVAVDESGALYLNCLELYVHSNLVAQKSQATVPSAKIFYPEAFSCALLSDSHRNLADYITQNLPNLLWTQAAEIGVGWWLSNVDALRCVIEVVARSQWRKASNPLDCFFFYLILGKKRLVTSLWHQSSGHPEQHIFLKFLMQDDTEAWRRAAHKNAFVLLGKQRFELAASFFILARQYDDAISVCLRQLGDIQLACVTCRLLGIPLDAINAHVLKTHTQTSDLAFRFITSYSCGIKDLLHESDIVTPRTYFLSRALERSSCANFRAPKLSAVNDFTSSAVKCRVVSWYYHRQLHVVAAAAATSFVSETYHQSSRTKQSSFSNLTMPYNLDFDENAFDYDTMFGKTVTNSNPVASQKTFTFAADNKAGIANVDDATCAKLLLEAAEDALTFDKLCSLRTITVTPSIAQKRPELFEHAKCAFGLSKINLTLAHRVAVQINAPDFLCLLKEHGVSDLIPVQHDLYRRVLVFVQTDRIPHAPGSLDSPACIMWKCATSLKSIEFKKHYTHEAFLEICCPTITTSVIVFFLAHLSHMDYSGIADVLKHAQKLSNSESVTHVVELLYAMCETQERFRCAKIPKSSETQAQVRHTILEYLALRALRKCLRRLSLAPLYASCECTRHFVTNVCVPVVSLMLNRLLEIARQSGSASLHILDPAFLTAPEIRLLNAYPYKSDWVSCLDPHWQKKKDALAQLFSPEAAVHEKATEIGMQNVGSQKISRSLAISTASLARKLSTRSSRSNAPDGQKVLSNTSNLASEHSEIDVLSKITVLRIYQTEETVHGTALCESCDPCVLLIATQKMLFEIDLARCAVASFMQRGTEVPGREKQTPHHLHVTQQGLDTLSRSNSTEKQNGNDATPNVATGLGLAFSELNTSNVNSSIRNQVALHSDSVECNFILSAQVAQPQLIQCDSHTKNCFIVEYADSRSLLYIKPLFAASHFLPEEFGEECQDHFVAYDKGLVEAWDKSNVPRCFTLSANKISRIRLDASGTRLCAGTFCGGASVFNVEAGRTIVNFGACHQRYTSDVAFLKPGGTNLLVTTGSSPGHYGNVAIWDTLMPSVAAIRATRAHEAGAAGIACLNAGSGHAALAPGNYIYTGGRRGDICVTDLRRAETPVNTVQAFGGSGVSCMALHDNVLYAGSVDGSLRVWDVSVLPGSLFSLATINQLHMPRKNIASAFEKTTARNHHGITDLVVSEHTVITCGSDGTVKALYYNGT